MNIIKLLCFLLIFINARTGFAQILEPFEVWTKKRPAWMADKTEVAYAVTRCGALFIAVGGTFVRNPSRDEDVKFGNDLLERARNLALTGTYIARESGMSVESSSKRLEGIAEVYINSIKQNRLIHNNMFHDYIGDDFKFCVAIDKVGR